MTDFMSSATSGSSGITGQLDVQWIVEQIIYAKQQPIRDLETYQTFYEAKKTAFQELNTKLSSVESSLYSLNTSGFSSKTASVSNDDILSASTTSVASEGSYYIIVRQLAMAQSDGSDGFSSADDLVLTDGTTFSITQNGETVDIDISGDTRSLNGLKNAINSSGLDITATVIYDGSDYKLQITSDETGTENAFTVDDTGVGTNMTNKIAAQDALINVNTTDASDAITRSTNVIDDVIEGVTLNLKKADTSEQILLQIDSDTSGLKEKIQNFVDSFNDAINYLNEQFTYNEEEGRAGVLSGEAAARKAQMDLLQIVSSRVEGIDDSSGYKTISNIGITINKEGNLEIDESALDDALTNHLEDVKRIFKDVGTSTNSDISYVGKSENTEAGRYEVIITSVAEKASVQGDSEITTDLSSDETLTITYNGDSYTVDLTTGMDIDEIVNAINNEMDNQGVPVYATKNGNYLVIGTNEYGSSQSISVVSSGSQTGFSTTHSDTGVDVAGTIGGYAATGEGRVLTANEGDPNGLMVFVSATTTGNKGDIYLTFGAGENLRQQMYDLTYPYSGLIAKNIEALDDQLTNIQDKINSINRQLEKESEILVQQFTKANEALAQLQYLQSTLSNNFTK